MELRVEQLDDNVSRITPVGRWDTQAAAILRPQLRSMTEGGRRIIVDMSEVDYLASMGIGSLLLTARAALQTGGMLVLMAPKPAVADVLVKANIDQIIPVRKDLSEALGAVKARYPG